jgi:hypothetical protein
VNQLLSVCWFDPNVTAEKVQGGFRYRVSILHGKAENLGGMLNTSTLTVKVKRHESMPYEECHKIDYLDSDTIERMPAETIIQTYLTTIDLTESQSAANVRLEIFKKDDWWK